MFRLVPKIQQSETYFELFKNYRSKGKLGHAEKCHQISLGEKKNSRNRNTVVHDADNFKLTLTKRQL